MKKHITLFVRYCAFAGVPRYQMYLKLSKAHVKRPVDATISNTGCTFHLHVNLSRWDHQYVYFLNFRLLNQNGGNSSSGGTNRMQEMWLSRSS